MKIKINQRNMQVFINLFIWMIIHVLTRNNLKEGNEYCNYGQNKNLIPK